MYLVIAYCVLVGTGLVYCIIHDHMVENRELTKHAPFTHLNVRTNRSTR